MPDRFDESTAVSCEFRATAAEFPKNAESPPELRHQSGIAAPSAVASVRRLELFVRARRRSRSFHPIQRPAESWPATARMRARIVLRVLGECVGRLCPQQCIAFTSCLRLLPCRGGSTIGRPVLQPWSNWPQIATNLSGMVSFRNDGGPCSGGECRQVML